MESPTPVDNQHMWYMMHNSVTSGDEHSCVRQSWPNKELLQGSLVQAIGPRKVIVSQHGPPTQQFENNILSDSYT